MNARLWVPVVTGKLVSNGADSVVTSLITRSVSTELKRTAFCSTCTNRLGRIAASSSVLR
ncbi:hypothetical protein D3C71_2075020 [compost metagenome]